MEQRIAATRGGPRIVSARGWDGRIGGGHYV